MRERRGEDVRRGRGGGPDLKFIVWVHIII